MKLVLLGTAGYHPTERRHTACLMLPEVGVLLDAGTGLFRINKLLQTPTLDIFLTHAHLDHVVGLTYLLDVMSTNKLNRVTVHALPEKLAAIDQHLFNEHVFPVKPKCEMRPLVQNVPLTGGGVLRHFPLVHPGGSLGFRLDWQGHSLAYVTDTATEGAKAAYLEHIRGVDLLLHECYYPDGMEEMAKRTGHCCATPVAQVARAAGAKRLLLIHTKPVDDSDDSIGLETIRAIFPQAELAQDGLTVDF
jgi:ribonuclease Z